jgi:hypothetical protein
VLLFPLSLAAEVPRCNGDGHVDDVAFRVWLFETVVWLTNAIIDDFRFPVLPFSGELAFSVGGQSRTLVVYVVTKP